MVTRIWGNVPVFGSSFDVQGTIHYLVHPTEVLNCLKFPPLISVLWACTDNFVHEFLIMVTKGVVHGLHKVMNQLSYCVIRRHKVER